MVHAQEETLRATSVLQASRLTLLNAARRKVVDFSPLDLVKLTVLRPEDGFPLVIEPSIAHVDLAEWAEAHREFIETNLLQHGAILFRGFNVGSAPEFYRVAHAICPSLVGDYGDLPPEGGTPKVYQSTPYPEQETILFHNEASHTNRWPMKQFFGCMLPARQGGETPITDCRKVCHRLDPQIIARFRDQGVMYIRNFIPMIDVSWQEFFKTSDRSVVEAYCRKASIALEWKDDDGLRIRQVCPGVARHPKTGEMVFFNQVQLHHISCLPPQVRESLLSVYRQEDLPRHCTYGDGSPIEDSVMEAIDQAYWQAAVSFPWQQGDILMVDNMLMAHARKPYQGPRKIVVAMGEMITSQDIELEQTIQEG